MIDSIYWLNGLLYLAMGFAAAWCVFSGIPRFLAFVWKGTKQVLQILAGILGASALIAVTCWGIWTYLV